MYCGGVALTELLHTVLLFATLTYSGLLWATLGYSGLLQLVYGLWTEDDSGLPTGPHTITKTL